MGWCSGGTGGRGARRSEARPGGQPNPACGVPSYPAAKRTLCPTGAGRTSSILVLNRRPCSGSVRQMSSTVSFSAAALALLPGSALAEQAVDIGLVLAVDISGSVDASEQELERTGLVEAFKDPGDPNHRCAAIGACSGSRGLCRAGRREPWSGWRRPIGRQSIEDWLSGSSPRSGRIRVRPQTPSATPSAGPWASSLHGFAGRAD